MTDKVILDVLHFSSLRALVNGVNERGIEKNDIVQILKDTEEEGFFLLYYK